MKCAIETIHEPGAGPFSKWSWRWHCFCGSQGHRDYQAESSTAFLLVEHLLHRHTYLEYCAVMRSAYFTSMRNDPSLASYFVQFDNRAHAKIAQVSTVG